MEIIVLEEFSGFALNCEENLVGGIGFYSFFGFWALVHVAVLRRGDTMLLFFVFGGNFKC
jgi:hypothetical protein